MSESSVQNSGSLITIMETGNEEMEYPEPDLKKLKASSCLESSSNQIIDPPLEERLVGVLCCVVCLDIPNLTIYQCTNGHLMCSHCLDHLLADARIRDDNPATCPQCRCEIGRASCVRVLAVEKAISELPAVCTHCRCVMPRTALQYHEKNACMHRRTSCVNSVLGCAWEGKISEQTQHEATCEYNAYPGSEIRDSVIAINNEAKERIREHRAIIDLFSNDRAAYVDIQLKPSRTDDYIPRLYYESTKFSLHHGQWIVKAKVVENTDTQTHDIPVQRSIVYQLIMKSKPTDRSLPSGPISTVFFALKGPFGDIDIIPTKYEHEYVDGTSTESTYNTLTLSDTSDCNRLISSRTINFRLYVFLVNIHSR